MGDFYSLKKLISDKIDQITVQFVCSLIETNTNIPISQLETITNWNHRQALDNPNGSFSQSKQELIPSTEQSREAADSCQKDQERQFETDRRPSITISRQTSLSSRNLIHCAITEWSASQ